MEPNFQPPTNVAPAPLSPDIPPAPNPPQATVPRPHNGRRRSWAMVVLVLILAFGLIYGVYSWQHSKLKTSQQSLTGANSQISALEAAQKLYALPTSSDFGPECASKDNSELVSASLTPKPVDNYQAYLVACANDTTIPVRVMAFKIGSDGSRSFAYGAGTGEPLCISSKIINATAAQDISKQTGVPICKTF